MAMLENVAENIAENIARNTVNLSGNSEGIFIVLLLALFHLFLFILTAKREEKL